MSSAKYAKVRFPVGLVRELTKELGDEKAMEEFVAKQAMHGLIRRRQGVS